MRYRRRKYYFYSYSLMLRYNTLLLSSIKRCRCLHRSFLAQKFLCNSGGRRGAGPDCELAGKVCLIIRLVVGCAAVDWGLKYCSKTSR